MFPSLEKPEVETTSEERWHDRGFLLIECPLCRKWKEDGQPCICEEIENVGMDTLPF